MAESAYSVPQQVGARQEEAAIVSLEGHHRPMSAPCAFLEVVIVWVENEGLYEIGGSVRRLLGSSRAPKVHVPSLIHSGSQFLLGRFTPDGRSVEDMLIDVEKGAFSVVGALSWLSDRK